MYYKSFFGDSSAVQEATVYQIDKKKLDFSEIGQISFYKPDTEKFPCLQLAFDAIGRGGNIPCVLNAANEAAVAAYLHDEIGFYGISEVVSRCMEEADFIAEPTIDDIYATNDEARARASEIIKTLK